MPSKTITIDAATARHYLRMETVFNRLCETLQIDGDCELQVDANQRYAYRCDLHDNWARRVSKKEVKYGKGGKPFNVKEIF